MMNTVLRSLLTYVAKHPHQLGDCDTILDVIYDRYKEYYSIETVEMKEDFRQLHTVFEETQNDECDKIIDIVCSLCNEHEKIGFTEGIKLGIRLAKELNIA